MTDFALFQVFKALPAHCELAVRPTRLTLEAEYRGLLSLDFHNAFNMVNQKVIIGHEVVVTPGGASLRFCH